MFTSATLKSVAFKFLYGAVATVLATLLQVIQLNPDPATVTLAAVKVGLLTAVVAYAKKFIMGSLFVP